MRHWIFKSICLSPLFLASALSVSCAPSEYQGAADLEIDSEVIFDSASAVRGGQAMGEQDIFRRSTLRVESDSGEICSGTLIASDILLLAAHCIVNAESDIFHVVGSVDGNFFSTVSIANRYHEKYKKHSVFFGLGGFTNSNDVAVLLLRDEFPQAFVPALLPQKELTYKNQEAVVAGYGYSEGSRHGEFGMPYFGSTKVSSEKGESIVLKQEGAALTCPGDSGGPVYTVLENNLTVIGIHSWGNCSRGIANSESVGQHLAWLKKKIAELRALKLSL